LRQPGYWLGVDAAYLDNEVQQLSVSGSFNFLKDTIPAAAEVI
jgi:hypothetical protein